MRRWLGLALGSVLLVALSATSAHAQVSVGVSFHTGNVAAGVAVGPPPVYAVPAYYAPPPVYVAPSYYAPYYVRYNPFYVPVYNPFLYRPVPYEAVRYAPYYGRPVYYAGRPGKGWRGGNGRAYGHRGNYVAVRGGRRR